MSKVELTTLYDYAYAPNGTVIEHEDFVLIKKSPRFIDQQGIWDVAALAGTTRKVLRWGA